ncbi:MAG: NADH:flavin oxidoreductase [Candidatus Binatia bacterium]|nr:NADH:flavin oxidoreductase [Candidatus Binatia bacterium]
MVLPSASAAFSPARLGPITLKNRVIKAATFEGMSPGGKPSDKLTEFHRNIALGGVAMTTIAYCTTEADGRISDGMMYLHEAIEPELRRLTGAVHEAGALVSGQMTHCGNFSRNRKLQRLARPLGPSRQFSMIGATVGMPFAGAMTEADIDYLVETYRASADRMKRVGFDAAEIHFGHGYGLSQFISPKTNRRNDAYGGSLENRMRLPLRVLEAVRETVGDGFPILGKISMSDGVAGGVDWEEGVRVAQMLDRAGIDALVASAGTSSFNPMLMFRGPSIVHGMIEMERNPITRIGLRLIGPRMFKKYVYEELYLMDRARRVRDAVDCAVVYIGGCSTRESVDRAIQDGFDFVQIGRPLLFDPAFVRHAEADPGYVNGCTHCNRCVALIDHPDGIRCPLNDEAEQGSGVSP